MAYTRKRVTSDGVRWLGCWRGPDGRTRTKGGFTRKRDAQQYAERQEHAVADGTYVDPRSGQITLAEWWERWWPAHRVTLAPKTIAQQESTFRVHVLPRFGPMPLRRITHEEVSAWVAELAAGPLSAESVQKAHGILHKALGHAVKAKRISSNPASDVALPKVVPPLRTAIEPDRWDDLYGAVDDGNWRRFCLLATYAALREGEVGGQQWRFIDTRRHQVRVEQQVIEVSGHAMVTTQLKSAAARRVVPIPAWVAAALEDDRAAPDEFVVRSPMGALFRPGNFRKRVWQPACVKVGLGHYTPDGRYVGLMPHELRHTGITWWIENGATPTEVQRWAGHESLRMIEKRYGHLFASHASEVMRRLDGYGR